MRRDDEIGRRRRRFVRDLRRAVGEHHVGVGAAKPEGIHARQAPAPDRPRERRGRARHLEVQGIEIDVGAEFGAVQRGRQKIVLQGEHRLEHAAEPRCRLHMTDVGLDRSDQQRLGTPAGDRLADRGSLDRVADRCAGPVSLEEGERVEIDPAPDVELLEKLGLETLGRQRNAVGAPVRIDVGIRDVGVDGVTVAFGRRARLEHQHGTALGAHVAVGIGREGLAEPAPRQHRRLGEADEGMGADEDADAADERGVDAPAAQVHHRFVQRDQRRRAGRVDDEARAVQIEDVGEAVGDDRQRVAGHHVGVGRRHIEQTQVGMVDGRDADEDAGVRSGKPRGPDAGVFEAFPGQLQQQALLRVHLFGLTRRHAERAGIEAPDVVEHAGGERVCPPTLGEAGMQQPLVSPTIGGNLGNRAAALGQEAPEIPNGWGSGQTTCAADDSDILALVQGIDLSFGLPRHGRGARKGCRR